MSEYPWVDANPGGGARQADEIIRPLIGTAVALRACVRRSIAASVVILVGIGLSACVAAPTPVDDADLDVALCAAVNAYRVDHGLAEIPVSASLMTVARYHADDLATHGTGGPSCNLHSWTTGDSRWSGCCYTEDHAQAECMWNKPREIASYASPGIEIAAHGASLTPHGAVSAWNDSEHHRVVIANEGDFAGAHWRAMGCAMESGYATVWFGELDAP